MKQTKNFDATIGAKGRIVIPKRIRDKLNLSIGSEIEVTVTLSEKEEAST